METASTGSCFVSLLESGFPISSFFLDPLRSTAGAFFVVLDTTEFVF